MRVYWSDETQTYQTADGRTVKASAVRAALDRVIDAQATFMRDLTASLTAGAIALGAWQAAMMQAIKQTHLVGLATASGGWEQLDQTDFGWVGQRIRTQYQFLVRFTIEVSSGRQALNGTAVARAALYAQAARETHREAQRRLARARRIVGQERRVLAVADHCRTCLQQARLGWQPFGTLKRIGDSECRSNCRCWFEFRTTPAALAA